MDIPSRKQAAELVRLQLSGPDQSNGEYKGRTMLHKRFKEHQHHYGKQELRELLDFIYGPPKDESEFI